MDTREQIIATANNLLLERGFNAFSYKHISEEIAIKTSSIHYHFPTKSDLGVAIIRAHREALAHTIEKCQDKTPLEKIGKLLKHYQTLVAEQKVCIASALMSDINTLDDSVRQELLGFGSDVINWIASILDEGQAKQIFRPMANTRLKAKLIMSNLMGLIQVARLEKNQQQIVPLSQLILDDLLQ